MTKKPISFADKRRKDKEDELGKATSIEEVARWHYEQVQDSIRALNMILEGKIDDNPESDLQNTTERGQDILDFFMKCRKISDNPIPINEEQEKTLMIKREGNIEQIYRFRYATYLKTTTGGKL